MSLKGEASSSPIEKERHSHLLRHCRYLVGLPLHASLPRAHVSPEIAVSKQPRAIRIGLGRSRT